MSRYNSLKKSALGLFLKAEDEDKKGKFAAAEASIRTSPSVKTLLSVKASPSVKTPPLVKTSPPVKVSPPVRTSASPKTSPSARMSPTQIRPKTPRQRHDCDSYVAGLVASGSKKSSPSGTTQSLTLSTPSFEALGKPTFDALSTPTLDALSTPTLDALSTPTLDALSTPTLDALSTPTLDALTASERLQGEAFVEVPLVPGVKSKAPVVPFSPAGPSRYVQGWRDVVDVTWVLVIELKM
jgi:hypothetical protein